MVQFVHEPLQLRVEDGDFHRDGGRGVERRGGLAGAHDGVCGVWVGVVVRV
jgi:hypothetical protein